MLKTNHKHRYEPQNRYHTPDHLTKAYLALLMILAPVPGSLVSFPGEMRAGVRRFKSNFKVTERAIVVQQAERQRKERFRL